MAISYVMPSIAVIVLYKRIIDKLKELSKNLNKESKKLEPKGNARYIAVLRRIKNNKIQNIVSNVSPLALPTSSPS